MFPDSLSPSPYVDRVLLVQYTWLKSCWQQSQGSLFHGKPIQVMYLKYAFSHYWWGINLCPILMFLFKRDEYIAWTDATYYI